MKVVQYPGKRHSVYQKRVCQFELYHNVGGSSLGIYIDHTFLYSTVSDNGFYFTRDVVEAVMFRGADLDGLLHFLFSFLITEVSKLQQRTGWMIVDQVITIDRKGPRKKWGNLLVRDSQAQRCDQGDHGGLA